MRYVALLRGINVGGNNRVEMARLRNSLESLGLTEVSTYINSGNIFFTSNKSVAILTKLIEDAIESEFGFHVHVVLRDKPNITALVKAIPTKWINDSSAKADVLFLWEDVDKQSVLKELTIKEGIDDVRYVPGAVIWHVDRADAGKSGLMKIIGTPLYKKVTIRNVNTTRKLAELL